jgi:hypothetical protein
MPAIVDTGPLVAFFDRAERHYRWVAERVEELEAPLLVCEPVLTETMYLSSSKMVRSVLRSGWRSMSVSCAGCFKNIETHRCHWPTRASYAWPRFTVGMLS